jgi:hypothetical protein
MQEAAGLYEQGAFEKALAQYGAAAEMPQAAFGEYVTSEMWVKSGAEYRIRRSARLGAARCLIELGRLDEAQGLLDRMEEERVALVAEWRKTPDGLGRIGGFHWAESDAVYWMLHDAREGGGPGR